MEIAKHTPLYCGLILAVGIITSLLAQKIKIPDIAVFLIVGVMIGPEPKAAANDLKLVDAEIGRLNDALTWAERGPAVAVAAVAARCGAALVAKYHALRDEAEAIAAAIRALPDHAMPILWGGRPLNRAARSLACRALVRGTRGAEGRRDGALARPKFATRSVPSRPAWDGL